MGDAVLRVRGHLQSLARENWAALEEKHARNVAWLRDELASVSRSLEIKARLETHSVALAPFPSIQEDVFSVAGPARKKQKVDLHPEEASGAHNDDRGRARLSMRLRERKESVGFAAREKKNSRKRSRPAEVLLKDPGKLKVPQLRSELKKRGLRTSGLKAVLFDRLLDALEEEQKEDEHLKKVQEEDEEQGETEQKQPDVIVLGDDNDEDEIVRESVGSSKSQGRSQSTSPKAAAAGDEATKDAAMESEEETEVLHKRSPQSGNKHAVSRTARSEEGLDTADTAPERDSAQPNHRSLFFETTAARTSHESIRVGLGAGGAEELINHDVLKLTRKSMQASGTRELTSPLAWKRKSILRKASSLAPSSHDLFRKVSFAPRDQVDIIVESSQTDSTQPDEKAPASTESDTIREEAESDRSDSDAAAEEKPKAPSSPVAPSTDSSSPDDPPAHAIPVVETEEQRKKREFEESVQREAEKLRRALKLSAQKRLEEAKASKAFWAKRDQLKAKLRASSAGDKTKSALTPVSASDKSASDRVSPATSEPSPSATNGSSASDSSGLTSSASKEKVQPEESARADEAEDARDLEFLRSMARHHEVEDISNVSSAFESSLHEVKATRATYSVVEKNQQVERSISDRPTYKPAARSMPASMALPKEQTTNVAASLDIHKLADQESQQSAREQPVFLTAASSPKSGNDKSEVNPPVAEASATRDSLSSTVSSIPDPLVVEDALKSGASSGSRGVRKPLTNLVSGLHSFTTLLEKSSSQESNSGRSAPVVNSLKLAERSRLQEEKKKLEKEKRKAILKKKMEEHKKLAALKEKAEQDAKAKREQERLNERKKREAELARKRQQKLKEMRAGLEKKRAMIAAEKKAGHASSAAIAAASHQKHRGLASASEASQPATQPTTKPASKAILKPVTKPDPVAKPAPKAVSKPVQKLEVASPVPAKHAPKSHSPEIVNYEMSDNAESSGDDSSDSDSEHHGKKKVPRWAQKNHLNKILHAQFGKNAIDPSPAIFQDFVDTCNLEAIFETTDVCKKKKFARRTSSGNWLADRPTARDRALYQRDMGYDQ